jgi:uncharacterized repeat protein (TIGR01451 family)
MLVLKNYKTITNLLAVACLSLFFLTETKAQYVTIPDATFRNFLQTTYPTCMSSGKLDTTCAAIVNATSLNISFNTVADLTGIQYFKSLKTLDCGYNHLTSLPKLPSSLTRLTCTYNQLTSLPALPDSLTFLRCDWTHLTSLPALPASLTTLWCHENQLVNLPALPASLTDLACGWNQLTNLPTLPSSLIKLSCEKNQLTSLPALPASLTDLECDWNQLTNLPTLPSSLTYIACDYNQLTSLSTLPSSLNYLACEYNQLTSLPTLPSSLNYLYCDYNQLVSLPALPTSLKYLYCDYNQLTGLPALPAFLTKLGCDNNQLTNLSVLPDSLIYLTCDSNKLTCLPFLPNSLGTLSASGNLVSCLPNIPIKSGFTSDIGYAVCSPFNNANGCTVYPLITGRVYIDANSNGILDAGESGFAQTKIEVQPGNYIVTTDSNGFYSLNTDTGAYAINIYAANYPYYTINPSTHSVSFHNYGTTDTLNDFALQPTGIFNDLTVTLTAMGRIRAGISTGYMITYRNIGTTTLSGNVQLAYDSMLSFNSASPAFDSHTGNILTWNFSNMGTQEVKNIYINFFTPITDTVGTNLKFTATVNPVAGDNTPSDNTEVSTYKVAGSYDPNFKEVQPEGDITLSQVASQDPFVYTVHFQNTGNDTAFAVTIKDTISSDFEILSIETIAASHSYSFQMKNGAAEWKLNNILLPDSAANEPASHGFVKYRIIPKSTLTANDEIKNTAHIFFDYNAPVVTNTTLNRVASAITIVGKTSIADELVRIYPNPSQGLITVDMPVTGNNAELRIFSTIGSLQRSIALSPVPVQQASLESLQAGIYFYEIRKDGERKAGGMLEVR